MSETGYRHPRMDAVLNAFSLLLNDSMALDYCGITGKERKLILNDPDFKRESKRIKAEKYIEEINDINEIIKSLGKSTSGENARFSDSDEDPTKVINLKMKVATMRREMLSLSSNDKETEESESLNIFFIDVTREEFERLQNVEIHEGDMDTRFVGDESKEAPMDKAMRMRDEDKPKSSIPKELSCNIIEYIDENGEKIIEEVSA